MFDFEKLSVYQKAKEFNAAVSKLIMQVNLDRSVQDQLRRAAFSIMLNIAEGSGRFTNPDKRNFYVIARGSVFECAAILDYLKDLSYPGKEFFGQYYTMLEEISRMLYALIKGLK
jgi:four helix bundle protein